MGWLGSLFDPGGIVTGESDFSAVTDMFDPAGGLFDKMGLMPDFYSDMKGDIEGWAGDITEFDRSAASDMWKKVKNDPSQLFLGAADPFGAKVANKVYGTDYDPLINQYGGPTNEAYQSAERKGIDTSNARGANQVAQAVASYYAGGALGNVFGGLGATAGIGAPAGQAIGGGLVGGGNAWANGGSFGEGALTGALPGLSEMFGGALNGVNAGAIGDQAYLRDMGVGQQSIYSQALDAGKNVAGTLGVTNPTLQTGINNAVGGAARGALQAGLKGDSMTEGGLYGGVRSGLGNLFGQGLQALGTTDATGNSLGNTLAAGALGMYGANRAKKDIQGQIGQLQSLFSADSPYAQQLQQQLNRKDAQSGRRSQYGPRQVELQARLAELNSRNAPQLNNLYGQKRAQDLSQYKDLYNVLRSSGLMSQLGQAGQQYFQGLSQPMGNYNQGELQGPLMSQFDPRTWNNDEVEY